MRIISGVAKGHKLSAPRGNDFRPTTDRVKENIFNILGSRIQGASVLDLFAGSGALGIEALSRGAKEATFVDSRQAAVRAVQKNLKTTELDGFATVLKYDAAAALDSFKAAGKRFDLIFLDPPYKIDAAELQNIFSCLLNCLVSGALVVLEHGRELSESPNDLLKLIDSRRYGGTFIFFYTNRESGS